jgi:hypothetical protein
VSPSSLTILTRFDKNVLHYQQPSSQTQTKDEIGEAYITSGRDEENSRKNQSKILEDETVWKT